MSRVIILATLAAGLLMAGCAQQTASTTGSKPADAPTAAGPRVDGRAKEIISQKMESLLDDSEENALATAVQLAATGVTNGQVNWIARTPDGSSSTANGRVVPQGELIAAGDRTCRHLQLKTWKGAENPIDDILTVCRPTQTSTAGTLWLRSAG